MFTPKIRNAVLLSCFLLPLPLYALIYFIRIPVFIIYLLPLLFFGYLIGLYFHTQHTIPVLSHADVIYSEKTCSGFSHLNIFTKLGGSRNCLWVRITPDFLIISSWFPFSFIAPIYDGVHTIPITHILSVTAKKGLISGEERVIEFRDAESTIKKFSIYPKSPNLFDRAIAKKVP